MRYKKHTTYLLLSFLLLSCSHSQQVLNARLEQADQLLAAGNTADAYSHYQSLAEDYAVCHNTERTSLCYYNMATIYLNQRDTAGMNEVLHKMLALQDQDPNNGYLQYDYLSVRQTYGVSVYEATGDTTARNQAMLDGKQAVKILEQMTPTELHLRKMNPTWNYYNIAVSYDLYYNPRPIDSIVLYLDRARTVNNSLTHLTYDERLQGDISICDLQAWLYLYQGQYEQAEKEIRHVLTLIDTINTLSPNAVLTEQGEAYTFMVELYKTLDQPALALEWQQRYTENSLNRFSVEKNRAVHEVETQYEVEKKDRTIQEMRWLIAGLILILVMIISIALLQRRNREQAQYEAAIDADSATQAQHLTLLAVVKGLMNDFPIAADALDRVDLTLLENIISQSTQPLTLIDKRYLVCFLAGLKANDIASLFHVEPASVYTVRYRLKKKFPKTTQLPI